ncbi:MAG: hypothetical protein K2J37_01995, partial [Ruminococcus sp.]|nr:hypothetical protein [Ruminococcus sp.]
ITAVISNFFALSYSINNEWWFIQTYICVMLLGLVYFILLRKNKYFAVELFIVFIIDILARSFFPALKSVEAFNRLGSNFFYNKLLALDNPAQCFFAGITFAKFDAIVKMKKKLSEIPCSTIVSLVAVAAVMWCRSFVVGDLFDIVYVISFIVLVSQFFDGVKPVKKIFGYLGKHSTNIWLIHSFFCYYFLEATKIVYSTKSVWIDLLILTVMSLAASIIVDFIFRWISVLYEKFKVWSTANESPKALKTGNK